MKRLSVGLVIEAAKNAGGGITRQYWADDPSCRILVVCVRDRLDNAFAYYHHSWPGISINGEGSWLRPKEIVQRCINEDTKCPFMAELAKLLEKHNEKV